MAVVDQLNLNVGTEQNPNFVLHDINDKRISTTAVTTATHLLTCNSIVTSIAPITAANLASVLGVDVIPLSNGQDLNSLTFVTGRRLYVYYAQNGSIAGSILNKPENVGNYGFSITVFAPYGREQYSSQVLIYASTIFIRRENNGSYTSWKALVDS